MAICFGVNLVAGEQERYTVRRLRSVTRFPGMSEAMTNGVSAEKESVYELAQLYGDCEEGWYSHCVSIDAAPATNVRCKQKIIPRL